MTENLDSSLAPEMLVVEEEYIRVNSKYCQTIYIFQYPAVTDHLWLTDFYNAGQDELDISFFINPLDKQKFINLMRRKTAKMEAKLQYDQQKGLAPDFHMRRNLEDMLQIQESIERSLTNPFQISIVATCWADSVDELTGIVERIERLVGANTQTRRASMRHKDGYLSQVPLLENKLANAYSVKTVHTQGLTHFFPFIYDDNEKERIKLGSTNVQSQSDSKKLPKQLKNPATNKQILINDNLD